MLPSFRHLSRIVILVLGVVCTGDISAGQGRSADPPNAARGTNPAGLLNDASAAFKERRYADARDLYASAARLLPTDANVQFMIGYSSYMLGQLAEARAPLERALTLNPRLTDASTVLGLSLYRQGRLPDAVTVLEAGLKYAPGNKDLEDLLAKWRPEMKVEGSFYENRGAHFSVLFQGPSDDLMARRVLDLLEETYWRVGRTLSTYPSETVPVVLYTQEQFRSNSNAPDWAGAFYDGRIKIPTRGALDQVDVLKETLAHELTHVVVVQLAGTAAPLWLNEGLAELLESSDFTRVEQVLARTSRRVPHARLERDFNGLAREDIGLAYAQSAFAVKRMVDLRGMSAVVGLLQALGRGTPFDAAFQQAIAMRYPDFVAMLARY